MPRMPFNPLQQPVSPEEIKRQEEEKRQAEQKAWEEHGKSFAAYYQAKNQNRVNDLIWHRVDEKEASDEELLNGQARLSTLGAINLLTDGIYSRKNGEFDIWFQDGKATAILNSSNRLRDLPTSSQLRRMDSEVMDFLIVGRGCNCVHIDWDSGDPREDMSRWVDKGRLLNMLKLAAEKGLVVEFGPSVTKFLALGCSKTERDAFYLRKQMLDRFAFADDLINGKNKLQNFEQYAKAMKANVKLQLDSSNNPIPQSLFGCDVSALTPVEKSKVIKEQVGKVERRLDYLTKAREELKSSLEAYQQAIQNPDSLTKEGLLKTLKNLDQITDAAKVKKEIDSIKKGNYWLTKWRKDLDDPAKIVEAIRDSFKDGEKARQALLTEINNEMKDLVSRGEHLTPSTTSGSDEEKKLEKIKDRLQDDDAKILATITQLNAELSDPNLFANKLAEIQSRPKLA